MNDPTGITWETLEHRHIEKSSDWYWGLGIVAVTAACVSIILKNVLFGIVILLGATVMIMVAHRHPRMRTYSVSSKGVSIGDTFYPFTSLQAFFLDEYSSDAQLVIQSKHFFMPLIIIPVPPEIAIDVNMHMLAHLPEEELHEPFAHRLLEFFGF